MSAKIGATFNARELGLLIQIAAELDPDIQADSEVAAVIRRAKVVMRLAEADGATTVQVTAR